ncbi:ABC transporter substrate-binding protein [Nocardioides sp. cx-173]|uniref:ABC transporter substrate-binding protein n=1 Tax=Nocardioides sp. cx-173 TaxID=2898796 RepID=UPI001E62E481|nr:ABC transporter substrate-binding protein [Nocardioides sp. cx-173]MCD4525011.1 ABC transporter substrate-binding protein [Nocardioides sp. cx-173]UGB40281.1 ABC transporter substrate-binding protein [Nocardioides sp. cx-173]
MQNCGVEVVLDKTPQRAVLLKPAAATYLHELGILSDVVVARAGAYPRGYYDDATWAELETIPMLSDDLDASGHLEISKEVVLAQRPDLVLGEADNLTRDALTAVDIPLVEEPGLCPEPPSDPSFADIEEQLRTYGRIFDKDHEAEKAVGRLQRHLDEVLAQVDPDEERTAAVLYPTVGGGTPFAYGASSMVQAQLEAAGFRNVFDDTSDRVFEVTLEELIGRNPDVLILLHSDGDPADVEAAITEMNGAQALAAVENDAILTQLFNFSEPPSPLAIDGLENIVRHFQR